MAYKFEGDRYEFLKLLERNPGLMIFKYTAEWCKPCQSIKKEVDAHFKNISGQVNALAASSNEKYTSMTLAPASSAEAIS